MTDQSQLLANDAYLKNQKGDTILVITEVLKISYPYTTLHSLLLLWRAHFTFLFEFCIPTSISLLEPQVTFLPYGVTTVYGKQQLFPQFSSVTSNSLRPHRLQHARLLCPSPTPGAYSNSCPWRQWCHPTISSSVVPFSSCLQSFPASGSFPVSQFFASGGQSTGASAFSISPSSEYSELIFL